MYITHDYKCNKCEFVFQYRHSVSDVLVKHPECKQEKCDLQKLPSFFRVIKKKEGKVKKPGQVVKKHIEEAKEEVKQQKKEMQKEMDK